MSDLILDRAPVVVSPPREAAPIAPPGPSARVLGVRFDAGTVDEVADRILGWAEAGGGRYVCFSNAHSVIEAHDDPAMAAALEGADLNVPDGMSIVRELRRHGLVQRDRVYGPDTMLAVIERAARADVPVALYGSSEAVIGRLVERLPRLAPGLRVVEAISPPYRPLTEAEDAAFVARLRQSGARIVFVGLGCPRQEQWCAAHAARVGAVCLGVGAAFDFHAGLLKQAPTALQRAGLEWAFRLAVEPRRLWRRYARVVPRFLWGTTRERSSRRGGVQRRER